MADSIRINILKKCELRCCIFPFLLSKEEPIQHTGIQGERQRVSCPVEGNRGKPFPPFHSSIVRIFFNKDNAAVELSEKFLLSTAASVFRRQNGNPGFGKSGRGMKQSFLN